MKAPFRITLLFCLIISFASGQSNGKKNQLEGKIFTIQLTETGGKRSGWPWTTDEIGFKSGKLKSKVMSDKEKFPASDCKMSADSSPENSIDLTSESKNPGGSTIKWKVKITGNKIEGTADWTNHQGKQSYTFSGIEK